MGIRKNCSTGTRFPAHTVMYKLGLPARAKILGTLVGYQGIRSRSWAKAPLRVSICNNMLLQMETLKEIQGITNISQI